ncbi:MAG TPA: hypothetical protein VGJ93_08600 [Desulfuromonadaceae bacterium]|jgi:hypothetical protein
MSPFRNRLKTPEEIELDRKRLELSRFQEQLAEREDRLKIFKSEIRMFEQVYEEILGARITELEELEWQLDGLLGQQDKNEEKNTYKIKNDFTYSHHRTDLLDDDADQVQEAPQKSLKSLYREVAKTIHPDLASDEGERKRRQELMAEANQAYEHGDRSVLEDLLCEWEPGPDLATEMGVAIELVRVIRQIARVQQNIHEINRQLAELRDTDIFNFKLRVDEALSDGVDLMAEMAATVALNISKAKRRLATLRGETDTGADAEGPPAETRIVHFPVDQSCGIIYERSKDSVDYRDWRRLGNARGMREVFLDKALRLDVKETSDKELGFLETLQADDLQALFLHDIDDNSLAHLVHLSGLQELYLSNTRVSDSGLQLLNSLSGLTRLSIYHTAISDAGLANLSSMIRLRCLTCTGTRISEEGLNRFRQTLPGCKVVSFKWRYEK